VNAKGTSGDVETPNWFYTPLWRAAHDGRMASVRLLVERAADVNYLNLDGSNQALKTAAENERLEVAEYLLGRGAKTDLISAAMLGLADRVEALLEARPDCVHDRDSHGRGALDAATLVDSFRICRKGLHKGHDRVASILIAHGATLEPAHAASLGLLDELKRMVAANPGAVLLPAQRPALVGGTAVMESALAAARRRGRRDVVAYLESSVGR
jgi:ankyrin repeat protein